MIVQVEVTEGNVTVLHGDEEIVHWISDEWEEDSSLVPTIANAIKLAYTDIILLRHLVGKPLK